MAIFNVGKDNSEGDAFVADRKIDDQGEMRGMARVCAVSNGPFKVNNSFSIL